ncbi:hypothetical protein KWR14_017870 [Clostridioides difficile]|nr:hypothetical protein [Clostridioides difficile]EKS7089301.1 hypothetical protein [Clostridioides difficile]MBH7490617.1 hypothetical protein [Clostridioides difficile]MBY1673631.1 hypothetical protein [Clostridioides difficile]MBY1795858.1 hypothetical protein [Clostridioides difficile]
MGDFMSFKSWSQNRKDKKYFRENKESAINYQKYYAKIYNYYREIDNINDVRNIEIEQTRIKGQLEKINNPGNALYIALLAVIFSLIASLFFDVFKTDDYELNLFIKGICIFILIFIAKNSSLDVIKPYKYDIQFYTTSLDVLEDMKKKKLREKKYKKRR